MMNKKRCSSIHPSAFIVHRFFMSYLVDGNNLIGRRADSLARRELMDALAAFVAAKQVKLSVVFDGAPEDFFGDGATYRGVKIFYAERGASADERIKRFVEESRERRTLIVVTSDRQLSDYVRRCGARVVNCREFRARLKESAGAPREIQTVCRAKTSKPSVAETDEWMRYFGVAPEDDAG